jgi:regulatory protein
MMKITDIKQQVKRQERYSIFVDKKYSFSLSEAELIKSGIRIGREYTETELDDLHQAAVRDKAYMRVLDLLSRRARSEWELRDYLKRKEYDSPTIDSILNTLSDKGYVDDYKFAQSWVESRHLLKSISRRKLWQELKQKHIADDVIARVLDGDETDERATLQGLIEKKRTQSRYQEDEKLIAYLLRQGYRYDDVKTVLATMAEQE